MGERVCVCVWGGGVKVTGRERAKDHDTTFNSFIIHFLFLFFLFLPPPPPPPPPSTGVTTRMHGNNSVIKPELEKWNRLHSSNPRSCNSFKLKAPALSKHVWSKKAGLSSQVQDIKIKTGTMAYFRAVLSSVTISGT